MGLVILIALLAYLALSVGAVFWAVGHAKKHGKSVKLWGFGAALIMYLIPFWDWIPTVVAHKYYCSTEAGFWVYKTVDQWKAENPGVMETLLEKVSVKRVGDDTNFTDTYLLNQRVSKVVQEHRTSSVLHVFRHEQDIVDTKDNQVLAHYVDFRAGYPSGLAGIAPRSAGLTAGKFWMASGRCIDGGAHPQHQFFEFEKQMTGSRK